MRCHRMMLVLLAISLTVLSGCGGDEPEKKLPPIGTSTPSVKDTTEKLPTSIEEAKKLHLSVLGENAARTDEEKAVVKAWMARWEAITDTYYTLKPSPQLNKTMEGEPLVEALTYLAELKAKDERLVGWARDNVKGVEVNGSTATVRDCTENMSFTVNAKGEPTDKPTPFYDITGTLTKKNGAWIVTKSKTKDEQESCL